MAFKMKKSVMKLVVEAGDNRKVENKQSKSRSELVPGKGEYEGKMVDPRTGMPPGVSRQPSDMEVANKDKIAELRAKMKEAEPFSDEEAAIRQQIRELRGR